MPSRWRIELGNIHPNDVQRHHVHAAVTSWFDAETTTTNPDGSTTSTWRDGTTITWRTTTPAHITWPTGETTTPFPGLLFSSTWLARHANTAHQATTKPYTATPVTIDEKPHIVVTLLDDALANYLHTKINTTPHIQLGQHIASIENCTPTHIHSWPEIRETPAATKWKIVTDSPITFRPNNSTTTPIPSNATALLATALRAHDLFSYGAPPLARLTPEQQREIVITHANIQTVTRSLGFSPRKGATNRTATCGQGTYEVTCLTPQVAERVAPVMALLPYAGIGAYTARGLGAVTVEPVRQDEPHASVSLPSDHATV